MASPEEAEKLEAWIDATQQKIFKAAAGANGRRRSSVVQSKDFTNMVKDLKADYAKQGFQTALGDDKLEAMLAKKPTKASKKGTLKEKNDAMLKLLDTVEERTQGMNEAWEHFASADPAFANLASYRNTDKTCPTNSALAAKNQAIPYDKSKLDEGMDMFETQFDGVMKALVKTCGDDE